MLMDKLPQERMVIAWQAMAMMEAALEMTVRYTHERRVFGKALFEMQNTQFVLAELKTQAVLAKTRSEERRVGKACVSRVDLGGRRSLQKKPRQRTKTAHNNITKK